MSLHDLLEVCLGPAGASDTFSGEAVEAHSSLPRPGPVAERAQSAWRSRLRF